jgi:CBS domain-containing protein
MGLIRLGKKPPLTVAPLDTVLEAVHAMTERHVGAATVVQDAHVVGVFSERDVMQKVVGAGLDARTTKVRDVMSSPVVSVTVHTTVAAAADLMRMHHIRHLPVVDEDGMLVGMIALRYLLYDMMEETERKLGDLEGYLMADGPGG